MKPRREWTAVGYSGSTLTHAVGEPVTYVQVSPEAKGYRDRLTSVFKLPDHQGQVKLSRGGAPRALAFSGRKLGRRIPLPPQAVAIYRAVKELEAAYPGRRFTPDGHLVGSIGEVIAAEALSLTLHPMSYATHDAFDVNGDVQIKMTGGKRIAMYERCVRLVVLQVVSTEEAEIIYDGPGETVWNAAAKIAKNGQRSISVAKLKALAVLAPQPTISYQPNRDSPR